MNVVLKYVVLTVGRRNGYPVFLMIIELICVQVIIGIEGEQGSQQ